MRNLKKQSGLAVSFDGEEIILGNDVFSKPMHARTLADARPYLMDEKATSRRKNLYCMYRDAHLHQDESVFRKNGVRYDITVIFPGTLGGKNGEYLRTIGHTHPAPEIYEVLDGHAMFVLQQTTKSGNATFYISATKGEKIIIPSGYGHVTVNIGKKPLILADLFSDSIPSDYSLFKKHRGAAYWVLPPVQKKDLFTLSENESYTDIGTVSLGTPPSLLSLGIQSNVPLYTQFIKNPDHFRFLTKHKKVINTPKSMPLCTITWQGTLAQ